MPEIFQTKMKWEFDYGAYTPGGQFGGRSIVGNSLYQPDANAVTTFQPYGYSDMMNIYNNFTVTGCLCEARLENVTGSTGIEACLVANTSSSAYLTFQDASNDPRASKIVTSAGRTDGGGQILYLKQYKSSADVEGISLQNYMDAAVYMGSTSANPTQLWYFTCYINSTAASVVLNVRIKITATYYVKFFTRDKAVQAIP